MLALSENSVILLVLILNCVFGETEISVVVTYENGNPAARTGVIKALREFNSTGFRIININEIPLTEKITEVSLCKLINENGSQPMLMLDTSLVPSGGTSKSSLVKRVARSLGLPTISTTYSIGTEIREWKDLQDYEEEILINVVPPGDIIPHSVRDITVHFNISQAVVFYDDSFVMDYKYTNLFENTGVRFLIKELKDETYNSEMLNQIRNMSLNNYFILGSVESINQLLELAQENKMFGINHNWYLITKGRGKIKCIKCHEGSVTFLQPVKARSHDYDHNATSIATIAKPSKIDVAFYYDLTRFALTAIDEMIANSRWPAKQFSYPKCGARLSEEQKQERRALRLSHEMFQEGFYGMFGRFLINEFNHNLNYQEIILRLSRIELWNDQVYKALKAGDWVFGYPSGQLMFPLGLESIGRRYPKHYRVVTKVQAPFVIKIVNKTGTFYIGYCIDLINEMIPRMVKEEQFSYELYEIPDGRFGDKLPDGDWNGMIGEVAHGRADFALGTVAVMAERESVVDFTVPFYDLVGIRVLMKKASVPSHLFKFLTVLDNQVWLSVLLAFLLASVLMFSFDRLSPYSYYNNKEKYRDDPEKRDFSLKECMWFCMTSLTPQGGGEAPKNISGRMVAATWWLFGFIVIASYTANLAAFLTVSRLDSTIETLDHLSNQYRIRYAPMFRTASMVYFERMAYIETKFYEIWKAKSLGPKLSEAEKAKLAIWEYPVSNKYTKMLHQMRTAGMPETFAEGLRRVKASKSAQEGFAFVADATMVKYAEMTNCDVHAVGNEFSRKPLALVVKQNNTLKDKLSSAILKLLNERKLESLKEEWWNKNPEKKKCEDTRRNSDGISINNIGGVFIVIFVGVLLACLTLIFEYIFLRKKKKKNNNNVLALSKDENIGSRKIQNVFRSNAQVVVRPHINSAVNRFK